MDRTTLRELRRKGKRFTELEQTLRELEQRYRLLESTFPAPLIFCDSAGKVEHVNVKFEETFGRQADEVLGKVAPYLARSEKADHIKRLAAVADGREPPFQFQGQSKNGEMLDLFAVASTYEEKTDGRTGFLVVLKPAEPNEDLHGEHRVLPVAVPKSTKGGKGRTRKPNCDLDTFERFFLCSNVGMILVDLHTGTVRFNQKLADMTDSHIEPAVDGRSEGAFPRIREIGGGQPLWEMIAKGRGNPGADIQFMRANGRPASFLASVSVLTKQPGRPPVVAATVVDVTKHRARENRVKTENVELMKRSEILETELADAQSELNDTKQELSRVRESMVEINEAAKLLVSKVAEQRSELRESIAQNLDLTVYPLLNHLKTTDLTEAQLHLVDTLDFNLKHVAARFGIDLSDRQYRLSPREIQICRMIRSGKDSGEIAEAFGLARQTVVVHRKNIRKKLGLKKNKQNLAAYLREHM